MKVQLRYFASVREALGCDSETLETDVQTLSALRDQLIARGGGYQASLARGRAVRVALDQVMCNESCTLHDGAEIAFFPPVTGG
jgi:molybdopterin synthase sulfur carrier subunit